MVWILSKTRVIEKYGVKVMNNRKVHDGIVGIVIFICVALGHYHESFWLIIPAVLGLILFQSAFSGFCPLYYALDKISPEK
ncbi:MAG: DUF2892 domain-containing protein [Motiliproteus sp.]